ncbi:lipoyl synthase [uncultured Megasphaera sp.]|uniref:lipoyl synthase n=1 Tax=uncultured Megasphaera sp. TaxID=165188 RepID=UPI00265A1C55|nr:lipoyl synthase [uncultured Megasphaera sp.]
MKEQTAKKPAWLKQHICNDETYQNVRNLVKGLRLHTVCESANCPNIGECFGHKTATFLILGGVCTRACRYCAVPKGKPEALDPMEPKNLAEATAHLGLKHIVITSVTRDDLQYGGAEQFAACIEEVRRISPDTTIEILTPDFKGSLTAMNIVLNANPTVFNHNIETVRRLFPEIRPIGDYQQSLDVLRYAATSHPHMLIKSGIMVGLGETLQDLKETFADLRQAGVTILTIGQYLQPSPHHVPVAEYVTPEKFDGYRELAEDMGFPHVVSGPLVRSSYRAGITVSQCLAH